MNKKLLRIEYAPLSQAARWVWGDNPKRHDIEALIKALKRYGFQDPPKYDQTLNGGQGGLAAGNGRVQALVEMKARGENPPDGLAIVGQDKEWAIPVIFGNDLADQAAAETFAIDHNNLTMAGGAFDALDMARLWDVEGYNQLLSRLSQQEALPVTVNGEDLGLLLARLDQVEPETEDKAALLADLQEERAEEEAAGTMVRIGAFSFKLERAEYLALIEDIRQNAGFAEAQVRGEICRRLGIAEEGGDGQAAK